MSQRPEQVGLAPASRSLRLLHVVQSVLLVSAGYYAGGLVGRQFAFAPSGIAAIWPSTAILLVALLLTPARYWWMYLLAVVPTHLHRVVNFQRPEPPVVAALSQVASNAVYVVLAVLAVRLLIGAPPRFDRLRRMVAFILHIWLLQIVTAPTFMALTCRWRIRPHHQQPTCSLLGFLTAQDMDCH